MVLPSSRLLESCCMLGRVIDDMFTLFEFIKFQLTTKLSENTTFTIIIFLLTLNAKTQDNLSCQQAHVVFYVL